MTFPIVFSAPPGTTAAARPRDDDSGAPPPRRRRPRPPRDDGGPPGTTAAALPPERQCSERFAAPVNSRVCQPRPTWHLDVAILCQHVCRVAQHSLYLRVSGMKWRSIEGTRASILIHLLIITTSHFRGRPTQLMYQRLGAALVEHQMANKFNVDLEWLKDPRNGATG